MGATFPLISPFSAGPLPVPSSTPRQWIAVSERFEQFDQNLRLTTRQLADGQTKIAGVAGCLNSHYYGIVSYTANALYVGSWGKGTMSRPPRDVDVLFVLPPEEHERFERYQGNRQSALLQEVKGV